PGDPHADVLAVHVVDPVGEVGDEGDRIDLLPHEVRGIPVQPERLPVTDRLEGALRGPVVVGDLGGVDLVGEAHPALVEHVEDRVPALGEVLVALVDDRLGHRREHRHVLPDLRSGEADDGADAELPGEPGGVLHVLGGPLPDPLGIAVAPHGRADDRLVAEVDRVVADRLALEVVGDRPALQPVLLQDPQPLGDVVVVVPAGGIEMLTGDGDLEAVVPPAGRQLGDLLQGEIGPLAGEQGVRMRHGGTGSFVGVGVRSVQRETVAPSAASEAMIASSTRCRASPSEKSEEKRAAGASGAGLPAIATSRSRAWLLKAFSQPSTWPCGHHASRYGCSGSVTSTRVKPCSAIGRVASRNHSSLGFSRSKRSAPALPYSSTVRRFFAPVAMRETSTEAIAPPSSSRVAQAASSTVTASVPSSPGGGGTIVASLPRTAVVRWPVRCWPWSMAWEAMSPSAPEPAVSFRIRQLIGASASTSQSWR